MNITKNQIDDLNATIKIELGKEDYAGRVEKALKDYQKKVVVNGFRPGKTPMGIVKKMYGKSLLVDEINRSPAKTQAALFEVMEERQITNDGQEYRMDYPFLVIATQNPVEHEGTYRLPEAQLDRFIFKISVGYPTFEEEMQVLRLHDSGEIMDWEKLSPVLGIEELEELRRQIMQVRVDEKIKAYIVRLVEMTRESGWLYLGASPRASLALMKGAKAYAALQGRDFVVPEDIIRLAQPVFRHRIQLSAERELEGISVDQVITQLAAKVEVPR